MFYFFCIRFFSFLYSICISLFFFTICFFCFCMSFPSLPPSIPYPKKGGKEKTRKGIKKGSRLSQGTPSNPVPVVQGRSGWRLAQLDEVSNPPGEGAGQPGQDCVPYSRNKKTNTIRKALQMPLTCILMVFQRPLSVPLKGL